MLKQEYVQKLIESCDKLQQKTIYSPGCAHSSCRVFDHCMRQFDSKCPPNYIDYAVYFNAPIMASGFARIHRNGTMEMWTNKTSGWVSEL